jgi:hypothetical protein
LEASAVYEAVNHWRFYLEGRSKLMAVSDHDTLRHLLMPPTNTLNKRHARHVRNLQSFTGAMILAYRKGSRNEAKPLSQRADFYAQGNLPLFWDGDLPQSANPGEQSELPRSHDATMVSYILDADLSSLRVDVQQLYPEMSEMDKLKTRMGTRVRGQSVDMLLPTIVVFGDMQDYAFRTTHF